MVFHGVSLNIPQIPLVFFVNECHLVVGEHGNRTVYQAGSSPEVLKCPTVYHYCSVCKYMAVWRPYPHVLVPMVSAKILSPATAAV